MTKLSTLKTILGIEESQTRTFRKIAEEATDPAIRAVFRIIADNEATHAEWIRELIAFRKEGKFMERAPGEERRRFLEHVREAIGDEEEEADWFGEIADQTTNDGERIILHTIANDESRNARLLHSILGEIDR